MFSNQFLFHNVLYVLMFLLFSNGRVAEGCFTQHFTLSATHKSSGRSSPWTVRHEKKTKTKNASGKSVVLEGTTEMCLFVRGQEGKKLKWLLPVGRVLHSARWKQRRQRRVPRITVTSHAAFRRRSKCGGVCFLQRGCLRCEKCTCGATASVGRNL